jgi:hypothetical protein
MAAVGLAACEIRGLCRCGIPDAGDDLCERSCDDFPAVYARLRPVQFRVIPRNGSGGPIVEGTRHRRRLAGGTVSSAVRALRCSTRRILTHRCRTTRRRIPSGVSGSWEASLGTCAPPCAVRAPVNRCIGGSSPGWGAKARSPRWRPPPVHWPAGQGPASRPARSAPSACPRARVAAIRHVRRDAACRTVARAGDARAAADADPHITTAAAARGNAAPVRGCRARARPR